MAGAKGAFYFWKSIYQPDVAELEAIQKLNADRLYIKFFDVDWVEQVNACMPIAPISWRGKIPADVEVVPVVYITNKSLQKTPTDSIIVLAKQIHAKINGMAAQMPLTDTTFPTGKMRLPEVQMDCDWTQSTRERYFNLLRYLKTLFITTSDHTFRAQLSATIRLHQIRYAEQSGIPPIDRGLLMCYNTGDLKDPDTENSILHLSEVRKYVKNAKDYPLQLDVALPLFSWGVLFRNGRFARLLNGMHTDDLSHNDNYQLTRRNTYKVLKSNTLKGQRILKNDVLRVEEVTPKQLRTTARLLQNRLSTSDNRRLLFFHLDADILKHYDVGGLKKLVK